LQNIEAKQLVTQKSITDTKKRTKFMKKHYQEIKKDSKTSWKSKKDFLYKRRKEIKKAEAAIAGLRKEENEREKKIQKLESQMFCLLRNC